MSKKKDFILDALNLLTWFLFVTSCIAVGSMLVNFILDLIAPYGREYHYGGLKRNEYLVRSLLSLSVFSLTALLFYFLTVLFKKLNFAAPFSAEMALVIQRISYTSLAISICSLFAHVYEKALIKMNYQSGMVDRYLDYFKSFLLMAAVVYIIYRIFQKGIELQNETDLTI